MTISSKTPLFKEERELTDESLISERIKTDESLVGSQKKAERKSDEKVKNARIESDETRAQGRIDSDIHSLEKNSDHLQEQRLDEDNNVEKERSLMDAVIRDERNQKELLLNVSLNKEREETDLNLSRERELVDIEVERSSKLFSEEITSHSVTQSALTSRDEFLAIVSHDLRNPIGAVVSGSGHLLDNPAYNFDGEQRFWIEFIKRNAESALRLISDILDMERYAAGQFQIEKTSQSLDELLKNSIDSLIHMAEEKKIKISRMPASKSFTINCDGDRVSQVLSNLLGNALKFTQEGGLITVDARETNKGFEISVSDNGPGIAEEQKKNIFARFAQINNKDRRGLGLGLYISRMLVEAHQGQIKVISTTGKGSTFTFSLPH